ncbi:hypothetical protein WJX72_000130 [[Myrmecia] bisecta]|uniref:S1 motif domain-containing protein n=1 Tax=[Myrmecia] bisecta TaxID=41462 RepID=A0AAW1QAU8_9CHLO
MGRPSASQPQRHRHSPSPERASYRERKRHSRERSPFIPHRLPPTAPALSSVQRATVHSVKPVGLFVQLIGFRQQALVHNSQISDELSFSRDDDDLDKVKAMQYFAPPNSQVFVKVSDIREDGKISCSMRAVSQADGTDLDPTNSLHARRGGPGAAVSGAAVGSDEPPTVGSIQHATVASVKPYGVFVKMDGFKANGLVHSSQVSDHLDMRQEETDEDKVAALSSIAGVGDRLFVKVVEVEPDESGQGRGPRIKCSFKGVGADGQDLDPSMSKYNPRPPAGGGRGRPGVGSQAAELAQGGKVDWGHLAAVDKKYGDPSKRYDLLGDEVLAIPAPPPPAMLLPEIGHGREVAPGAISSVEEALAILHRHGKEHKKHKKKEKGHEGKKKEKKHKNHKL